MKNKKVMAILLSCSLMAGMTVPYAAWAEEAATEETAAEEEVAAEEEAVEEEAASEEETAEEEAASEEETAEEEAIAEEEGSLRDLISGIGSLFGEGGELNGLISEGGVVSELFGEGGALSELVPEDVDVDGFLGNLSQQLGDAGSELYSTVNGVIDMVSNEDGSLNFDNIGSMADMFLDFLGGDSEEETEEDAGEAEDLETLAQEYEDVEAIKQSIAEYTKAENADVLEEGDASVVAVALHDASKELEDGQVKVIGYVRQTNFAADGEDLQETGSAEGTKVWNMKQAEDGAWEVAEEKKMENPDDSQELEALCEEVDATTEEFEPVLKYFDITYLSELAQLLEEHTEFTTVEYLGEKMTRENVLDTLTGQLSKMFEELFAAVGEEAEETAEETADAVEETAEEAADAVEEAADAVDEAAAELGAEVDAAAEDVQSEIDEAEESLEEEMALPESEDEDEDAGIEIDTDALDALMDSMEEELADAAGTVPEEAGNASETVEEAVEEAPAA